MIHPKTLPTLLLLFTVCTTFAQQKSEPEQRQETLEEAMREDGETLSGWNTELSLGADFISNLLINPAVAADITPGFSAGEGLPEAWE